MFDWTAQFSTQRKDYCKRTLERLTSMESILNTIAQYPSELGNLRELSQHFHQLAGSSAIYELDKLGETASDGEKICINVLKNGSGISKPEWKQLKDMTQAMQFLISQHPDIRGEQAVQGAPAPAPHTHPMTPHPVLTQRPTEIQRTSGTKWSNESLAFVQPVQFEKPRDIVMVDGDQANLMTFTRTFEQAGMQVRGYRTSDGARQALRDRLPDALILSIPLVDGPGYDVARELRQLPDGHVPPILIISRQTGFLDKVTAIRCGADAFFDQSIEADEMLKRLEALLERDKPSNYTILSVEDDPDQAVAIRAIIESVGYKLHQISDPRQFEEALIAINPDLLLLDVMLGPVSGFELARFVRTDDRYATTPIIFLTTQNQLNAHVESARVGGDEHLIKPVAPQLLLASVAGRLERARVLKRLIGRDVLTQFLTLSSFMEETDKLLSKRYQTTVPTVMLLIDIDQTELINDKFGYAAGDRVISACAKMLRQNLRNADIMARTGGDEFAIVMTNVDDRELAEVATQIIKDFQSMPHVMNGRPFHVTISAGAATLDADMDLKQWLASAQLALKSAKANGRNRVMKAKARAGR